MKEVRTMRAEEIELRVGSITEYTLTLMLYCSARVAQNILDDSFGSMNWQRHHSRDNANCIVSVWDGEKQCWVEKEDTGTEANREREKSICSDSFKRACVNWGVGRELYSLKGNIWIPTEKVTIREERGRKVVKDSFSVQSITYDNERRISAMIIVNQHGKVVYQYINEVKNKDFA